MSEPSVQQDDATNNAFQPGLNTVGTAPLAAAGNPAPAARIPSPLEHMADVPVTLVFEVARLEISIRQLLALKQGSLLDLPASSLDSIKILVDGETIAIGDIMSEQQRYGVRVEQMLPLEEGANETA